MVSSSSVVVSPLTQGRGLKHAAGLTFACIDCVAPHTGAWIETTDKGKATWAAESPLTQGRGLKQQQQRKTNHVEKSPLTQGRGLKLLCAFHSLQALQVAPHTGAWIETGKSEHPPCTAMSPLTQGRGLKQAFQQVLLTALASPLTQGRGLKRRK